MSDKRTTYVEVTAEHIAHGYPFSCGLCPVSLAIRDVISSDVVDVAVSRIEIILTLPGATWAAQTPPDVARFIGAFDNRDPVRPISFYLTWRVVGGGYD